MTVKQMSLFVSCYISHDNESCATGVLFIFKLMANKNKNNASSTRTAKIISDKCRRRKPSLETISTISCEMVDSPVRHYLRYCIWRYGRPCWRPPFCCCVPDLPAIPAGRNETSGLSVQLNRHLVPPKNKLLKA